MSDADIRYHLSEFCAAEAAEDWQAVHDESFPEMLSVRYRSCGPKRTWVSMSYEMPVPIEFVRYIARPEVLSVYPLLANHMMNFELVEHLAPGDCMVKLTFPTPITRIVGDLLVGQQGPGPHNVRIALCENVPARGAGTVVCVSLGEDWLDFAHASKTAMFVSHRPGKTEGSTVISYSLRSAWDSYPPFFSQLAKIFAGLSEEEAKVYLNEMPRLHPIISTFYTVVSLRGCCRGPPLIPHLERSEVTTAEQIGGYYWESHEKGCVAFGTYLMQLLKLCDTNARVFTSLNGQRLVPYQVAVLTSAWKEVEPSLKKLFAAQCSAYRFMRGGSGAPKLKVDLEARFACENNPLSEPTKLSIDDFMIFKIEHKTFVDFQVAQDSFVDRHMPRKAAEYP
eukprot:TRINITY_DN13075_c0_g4_i1.p1 TRINITY_DN13075_c0_g4~~TRINITY_DN13075_c0_g4_i1.p1  ORF type:complete len:394 (-),score=48.27 TRINITY_DN13075_c0_g4_i1:440-1621(-)